MKATRLKTEYMYNPVGIDIRNPRLIWNTEECISQSAYRVVAKNEEGKILLDTGKVESSSMYLDWPGEGVPFKTRVNWSLTLWDENGEQSETEKAFFETGLPGEEKWNAKWITGNYIPAPGKRYPADCFKKTFTSENVKKARLYITACGLFEVKINGEKPDDTVFNPGITDYRKLIHYRTFDVSSLVKEGENEITVTLADGWYRGSTGAWGLTNQYGRETKFIAMLDLYSEDGSVKTISTDRSWNWSQDGPIRFSDNKDGEIFDANLIPSYSSFARETGHKVIPSCGNKLPVREHEHLKAELIVTPKGNKVLDFGQNIAGYVSFRLTAGKGTGVTLKFGEMLDKEGEFTQDNFQLKMKKKITPRQQITYVCKDGINEYKPSFSVFGFRYVLVETDADFVPEDFTAIAVYTDLERTGYFECSDKLINKFFENTVWSAKGNSLDLPTDCPTRERHGWSGDAQVFSSTACYIFDYFSFENKYLGDMYTWQRKDGCLPHIAPDGGADFYMYAMNGSVGWADAGVIIPYVLWKRYGDDRILERYLPGMRRYASFMQRRCGRWYPTAKSTGLNRREKKYLSNFGQAYGEWLEPADVHEMSWKDCAVPHPEIATAYTKYVMDLMAEMEDAAGNSENAASYRAFSEGCRKSYTALTDKNKEYSLDTDRQARLVRPLYIGMLDEEKENYAKERLIKALDNYGWRLGTGFLSTPLILYVLSGIGPEYAYKLLQNEEMPGWLFMPKNEATTIWESWEGTTSDAGVSSLNHYSKGAVCSWLFDTCCGINVSGERQFTVKPVPGGRLCFARVSYISVYGEIKCCWEKKESGYKFTVSVPSNCSANVVLPDGNRFVQQSGVKAYEIEA